MKAYSSIAILAAGLFAIFAISSPAQDTARGVYSLIDFSRVGYHYGDDAIPNIETKLTISAPEDGSDATSLIQDAIDKVDAPGAILLKKGTYNVEGVIRLNRSGVVLRGEGDETVIYASAHHKCNLIEMGLPTKRVMDKKSSTRIKDGTKVGQMYVEVDNADNFKTGDRVVIFRPGTDEWIHDIKMDQILQRTGGTTTQWKGESYNLYWERTVQKVKGKKVWLDNPVVMALEERYGGGILRKCRWERISESGIEDICFVSWFDKDKTDPQLGYCNDEDHAWRAINIGPAEHCWVRRVQSRHFANALVCMGAGAKNITVEDCTSLAPVSILTGMRRYAFHFSESELCLVRNCSCDEDRHGFVTGAKMPGPNVFSNCTATNTHSDIAPHQRWATGVLYDCVNVPGGKMGYQDGGNWGSGHGWRAANSVLWNCEAAEIFCQSPWASAVNWSVGSIGERTSGRSHKDGLERPDGIWISYGEHVQPMSLYEAQLKERKSKGTVIVP